MIRLKTIAAFVRSKTFNFTSQLIHAMSLGSEITIHLDGQ